MEKLSEGIRGAEQKHFGEFLIAKNASDSGNFHRL